MGLKHLRDPACNTVGDTPEDFLQILGDSTTLHLSGKDPSRTRVLVTLTHANEPSGFQAVHRWLVAGDRRPAVNIVVMISSVKTALTRPFFSLRHLPGQPDLNRCFRRPYQGKEGRLAQAILQEITDCRPEAVVDMHNTSGSSPPFGVVHQISKAKIKLAGLFVDRLIDSPLRLGALMEQELGFPIVTIEAGGVHDRTTKECAWQGIENYFLLDNLYCSDKKIVVFSDPLRLELTTETSLDFAEKCLPTSKIVIRKDIEKFNSQPMKPTDMFGWLNNEKIAWLRVIENNVVQDAGKFFDLKDGKLYPRFEMQIFMATSQRKIAISDCLFYFVVTAIDNPRRYP